MIFLLTLLTIYLHFNSIWFINKLFCYTIFVCCHFNHLITMTNRIFININYSSELVYYIFISLHIEMFFDVANIRSSDGRTIFNALYFKSASSQFWCSRHWVRLPQMERTRDRAKPPMKRRTFFEVGSKRWVTTFFWGDLFITSSLKTAP